MQTSLVMRTGARIVVICAIATSLPPLRSKGFAQSTPSVRAPGTALAFSAVSDGKTDATAPLQKAIDSLKGGGVLTVPAGVYRITRSLRVPSRVRLQGAGVATVIRAEKGDALVLEGRDADLGALTADVEDRTLTVTDASKVHPGDWVALHNGLPYDYTKPNEPKDPGTQQEVFRVLTVQGNRITLDREPCFAYRKGRKAKAARREHIVAAAVSDLTIESAPGKRAVYANLARNCVIERVVVEGRGKGEGLRINQSAFCAVDRCVVRDTVGSTALFITYWSHGCRITNNHIEHHDINAAGDGLILLYFGCNNNVVTGNTLRNSPSTKTEIHGICVHTKSYQNVVANNSVSGAAFGLSTAFGSFDNVFTGNTLTSCTRGISLIDDRRSVVTGNTLRACGNRADTTAHSITVSGSYDGLIAQNNLSAGPQNGVYFYTKPSSGFTISDNQIIDPGGSGINIEPQASDITIRGNRIINAGARGITNYPSLTGAICDNIILRCGDDGIYLSQFNGGLLRGNRVEEAGGHGIVLTESAGNLITDNIIRNCAGFAFFFSNDANSRFNSMSNNLLVGNKRGRFELPLVEPPDTTLEFPEGFKLYNTDPSAGAPLGWRCIASGPGKRANWRALVGAAYGK
ncbi:MAG: right-handed parallel beta-helix repeat-containing protein [Armatimonadetes bacterium]|nr:right-handed parallel beta-helix repeat-containing protein [Armatimonadota bacterium]